MSLVGGPSIPPIEIGTFDAFHPQNSEFTGSSSGVFFVNTVFRAFAKLNQDTAANTTRTSDSLGQTSTNGFVDTTESNQELVVRNGNSPAGSASATQNAGGLPDRQTYGICVDGLGDPPEPALAKQLAMLYFEHWHPFFPFIHGPTFFEELRTFYEGSTSDQGETSCGKERRARLGRAVIYQCIFNIAESAHPQGLLHSSRIQSPSALLEVLGTLSVGRDLSTLQALMAAELYLVTTMSLRAASTIHGTITRLIYHAGIHRCPFRYKQLPTDVREMRKRILWCAYTHDRYLSQSLGHPLGLQDSDIDVCLPGANELHKPAETRHRQMPARVPSFEDVQSHLPRDHPSTNPQDLEAMRTSAEVTQQPHTNLSTGARTISHKEHRTVHGNEGSAVNIQEQFARYSQLVAEALELFHKSLHARLITYDKITELTYKLNLWWNSLPAGFQNEEGIAREPQASKPSYVAFFTISYHHLLILINRPFLSLEVDTMIFRSSLQRAITASRGVISKLNLVMNDPFLMTYPAMLSAVWMTGLVLAYATLLDMYPISKSTLEIAKCLEVLQLMSVRWSSAGHCLRALKELLSRLDDQSILNTTTQPPALGIDGSQIVPTESPANQMPASGEPRGTKRIRPLENQCMEDSGRRIENRTNDFGGNTSLPPNWAPIPEYNGPDFGFDSSRFDVQTFEDQFLDFDLNHTGLFNDMGWQEFDVEHHDG